MVSLRPLVLLDGKDPTVIYLFLYIYIQGVAEKMLRWPPTWIRLISFLSELANSNSVSTFFLF